jgi:putative FmdB family regulatory protein
MPLYEYKCDACGATFEMIQKFSDSPVKECRVCGGPVHKLLSAPAIQFKGSGWYVTDYAKKGEREAARKAEKAETSEAASSSASETGSKDAGSSKSDAASTPASEKKADKNP